MYIREIDGKQLTFAVSPLLYNESLVMVDSETHTFWSHLLGKAMRGPLEGQELKMINSVVCDWKSWKADHPDTTVLDMVPTIASLKDDYYADASKYIIGMTAEGQSRAWQLDHLKKSTIINDEFNGSVVIVHDQDGLGTQVFSSMIDSKSLTFVIKKDQMRDLETDSTWNMRTGKAIDGALTGRSLKPLESKISLKKAWDVFYPESSYWFPVEN